MKISEELLRLPFPIELKKEQFFHYLRLEAVFQLDPVCKPVDLEPWQLKLQNNYEFLFQRDMRPVSNSDKLFIKLKFNLV